MSQLSVTIEWCIQQVNALHLHFQEVRWKAFLKNLTSKNPLIIFIKISSFLFYSVFWMNLRSRTVKYKIWIFRLAILNFELLKSPCKSSHQPFPPICWKTRASVWSHVPQLPLEHMIRNRHVHISSQKLISIFNFLCQPPNCSRFR